MHSKMAPQAMKFRFQGKFFDFHLKKYTSSLSFVKISVRISSILIYRCAE